MSAWVKPASGSGTFSLYAAPSFKSLMSSSVSCLAHSSVVAIRPCLLGTGRCPETKLKPSSWPLLSTSGIRSLSVHERDPETGCRGCRQSVGGLDHQGVALLLPIGPVLATEQRHGGHGPGRQLRPGAQ